MGDPKKLKKKYNPPRHPWIKGEIEEVRKLRQEHGLRNRREILIPESFLKKYKNIAKRLIADQTAQGKKEKKQMMDKLHRLGLLPVGAELDDVLSIELKDILERRLQGVVLRKGLARSSKQARQFIVHRHIQVGEKEITSPGTILSTEEENLVRFKAGSSLADEGHPERVSAEEQVQKEKEVVEGKKEETVEEPAQKKVPEKGTKK